MMEDEQRTCPTIAIDRDGNRTVINQSDFKPGMKKWGEPKKAEEPGPEAWTGPLKLKRRGRPSKNGL